MTRLSLRPALAGLCVATLLAIAATDAGAQSAIDPNAQIVHLRQTCAEPSGTIDNCFESTGDLTTWIWGGGGSDRTVAPSASDRLAVHVGPGDFAPFECDGTQQARGWVSIIGSGRDQTRFLRTDTVGGPGSACAGAVMARNCQDLAFSHLTAQGATGAFWVGGGNATWSDVDMVGDPQPAQSSCTIGGLGWYDVGGTGGQSQHFFFGSRAIARGNFLANVAFDSISADSWFYGGDIIAEPSGPTGWNLGILTNSGAEVQVFGSTVRVRVGDGGSSSFSAGFVGADISGGTFHMHGGIISVLAGDASTDVDVWGVRATQDAFVHTPATAFAVQAGGQGTARRAQALGSANVQSPFVWPAGDTPPTAESIHGSDLYVDTDAGSSGGEAHLMVRDNGCAAGGGPWRDTVTGTCRP